MDNLGLLTLRPISLPGTLRVDVVDSWTAWLQAGAAVFTALALLIGGTWAYFRFVRGRTFEPRCSIDLNCSMATAGSRMVLTADVTVMNCGDSNVLFNTTNKGRVEVSLVNSRDWSRLPAGKFVLWHEADKLMRQDIFASAGKRSKDNELEPGQDMHRSCLFIMPTDWVAAQVRCLIRIGSGRKSATGSRHG